MSVRLKAILQALFVAFIWSTSWVFIKVGLNDVPPLLFAGLRYAIAALSLWILLLFSPERKLIRSITAKTWISICLIGLFYYALTQGSQYLGLKYLPTVTVNLILGLSTIVVALLGTTLIKEHLTMIQWLGVLLTPLGAFFYFFPVQIPSGAEIGLLIVTVGLFSGAVGTIVSWDINRSDHLPPLILTTLSITIGSVLMLVGGVVTEGFPPIPIKTWAIIIWMAFANTAFAFVVWNKAMRILAAAEISMINNTLMVQVPILAVLFLGETITSRQLLGMGLIIAGVILVQVFRPKQNSADNARDAGMVSAPE